MPYSPGASLLTGRPTSINPFRSILVGSPVTLFLWIYALRTLFGKPHRLSTTLGPPGESRPSLRKWRVRQVVSLLLVLAALGLWLTLVVFVYTSPARRFAQPTCTRTVWDVLIQLFYASGAVFILMGFKYAPPIAVILALPFVGTALAWVVAIVLQRRQIWEAEYSFRFWRVW
jgi:hypothetical protein